MTSREGFLRVPFELEPETVDRLIWLLAGLSYVIFIVSAIGEVLGWWNLVGEIGMTVGGVAGFVLTAIGVFSTSSRGQVTAVHETVRDNGRTLTVMDGKLTSMDGKLDDLDVIKSALLTEDGEASKLDVIQVELDRQTGVLDRQLGVLGEIRDAL